MACRLRASPASPGVLPSYGPTTWMLNTIGLIGTREYWKLATGGFGGRASYGMLRSSEPMNAALTSRVPALTGMRTSSRPPTPAPDPARRYSSVSKSNSLISPWSSRNSSLCPVPATGWLSGRSRLMRKTYSPSSGKWCRTAMPPREPNGRSSLMRPSCSRSGEVLYIRGAGTQRRVADGAPADLGRRRHVARHQPGRHRQHVADVVEAVARIVGRQQRAPIDLQPQQVAHGVRVFRPVEDGGPAPASPDSAPLPPRGPAPSPGARRATRRWRRPAGAGRRAASGPVRSLRTTFSHTSGSRATCSTST